MVGPYLRTSRHQRFVAPAALKRLSRRIFANKRWKITIEGWPLLDWLRRQDTWRAVPFLLRMEEGDKPSLSNTQWFDSFIFLVSFLLPHKTVVYNKDMDTFRLLISQDIQGCNLDETHDDNGYCWTIPQPPRPRRNLSILHIHFQLSVLVGGTMVVTMT